MLAYLSDEWISAMDEALAGDPAVRAAAADTTLVLHQEVTGGPAGDRAYTVWFDRGRAGVRRRPAPGTTADVTFTCDWDTAVAVATGKERAQAAFLAGRLRLGGDSRALMARAGVLAGLDDVFAAVRSRTDFSPGHA